MKLILEVSYLARQMASLTNGYIYIFVMYSILSIFIIYIGLPSLFHPLKVLGLSNYFLKFGKIGTI